MTINGTLIVNVSIMSVVLYGDYAFNPKRESPSKALFCSDTISIPDIDGEAVARSCDCATRCMWRVGLVCLLL